MHSQSDKNRITDHMARVPMSSIMLCLTFKVYFTATTTICTQYGLLMAHIIYVANGVRYTAHSSTDNTLTHV